MLWWEEVGGILMGKGELLGGGGDKDTPNMCAFKLPSKDAT